jgi:hypothetical protein
MHCNLVSPGCQKGLDKRFRLFDHQVDVEWAGGQRTESRHQIREEKQTGDKMGVGDIEVVRINPGIETPDFIPQASQIGGPKGKINP